MVVAIVYGLAFALIQPAIMALVVGRAAPDRRGAAMGIFTGAMDLGIGAGAFLWGFMAPAAGFPAMATSGLRGRTGSHGSLSGGKPQKSRCPVAGSLSSPDVFC
jgi:MFS family permease